MIVFYILIGLSYLVTSFESNAVTKFARDSRCPAA